MKPIVHILFVSSCIVGKDKTNQYKYDSIKIYTSQKGYYMTMAVLVPGKSWLSKRNKSLLVLQ